jgi:hypothetical protein
MAKPWWIFRSWNNVHSADEWKPRVSLTEMAHQLTTQQELLTPIALQATLAEFEGIILQRVNDAVNTLDTRQAVWKQTILTLQEQVTVQETLLHERIQAHEHRVLKAETTLTEWEQMLSEQEERLEAQEEAFTVRLQEKEQELHSRSMQKLDESFEAHQSTRILEAASEWQDHILEKAEEGMRYRLADEGNDQESYARICGEFSGNVPTTPTTYKGMDGSGSNANLGYPHGETQDIS